MLYCQSDLYEGDPLAQAGFQKVLHSSDAFKKALKTTFSDTCPVAQQILSIEMSIFFYLVYESKSPHW